MRVLYSSTWLASGGLQGTSGANWNGQQVNDEAQFFRAAASTFYARGNRSTKFGFGVNTGFNTEADAIAFAALQINGLPQQADLTVSDELGRIAVVLSSAVLDSVTPKVDGINVFTRYEFSGGVWASTDVPPNPSEDRVKVGQQALSINDESAAVIFATPFAAVPTTVNCWCVPPNSSATVFFIQSVALKDSISATGFTAKIGFPIPDAGWYLQWEAVA